MTNYIVFKNSGITADDFIGVANDPMDLFRTIRNQRLESKCSVFELKDPKSVDTMEDIVKYMKTNPKKIGSLKETNPFTPLQYKHIKKFIANCGRDSKALEEIRKVLACSDNDAYVIYSCIRNNIFES